MVIGFHKSTEPFEFDESRWFAGEKPEVLEAFRVLAKEGYYVVISGHDYMEREKRLKEEYEKNTKTPGPGEEQPKESNPALKEAASQFNDALLDEQAKKIKRLGKEIARLNGIIHEKNEEIKRKTKGCCELVAESVDLKEVLRKTESLLHDTREANSKNLHTCFKNEDIIDDLKKKLAEKTRLAKKYGKELEDSSLGLCKLEKKLADKNAVLSDVAEELRLSKIREKNLTEVCQKYMKENEELKNELADKVVDKIDAQALKSAESALVEKDEVIADLGNELAATKKELEAFKESYKRRIKEDSEHFEHIQKICNAGLQKWLIESEYLEKDKPFCFPQLPELSEEEEKKLNAAKLSNITAKCMKAARESINDVFESYAAKYAKSSLDDLKEKAYESFNAKAHSLGLIGSKDGNGLLNQMAGVDVAKEGADQSGKIVICGKDFAKILKENEEAAEELSKVLNDVIDQFLLFGEVIIKEEK